MSYNPAIPILGIYLEKIIIQKETFSPTFRAALFTKAKTWKQTKCPSMDNWMKRMWFTMEYHSAILKEQNNAICRNMDGLRDCHAEQSESEREE